MDSRVRLFQLGTLCGVILLIYGQTLDFGAMRYFDDPLYFLARPMIDDWWGATWMERLLTPDVGYPNPLPTVLYSMVRALPTDMILPAVHASSVAFFAATGLALSRLGRELSGRVWLGWWVAMIWCSHPVLAESVAWLTNLKTVMFGGGYGVAVWAWWRYLGEARDARWLGVCALGALLALGSRPSGVTLPAVMFALAWFAGGLDLTRRRSVLAPILLASCCAVAYVPVAVMNHDLLIGSDTTAVQGFTSSSEQVGAMGHAMWLQVSHMVWPVALDPIYDVQQGRTSLTIAAGWALLLCWGLGAAWGLMRKRALWGLALALGLIAYAPASNITFLPRFTADTYAFIPLFWLLFAAASGAMDALDTLDVPARAKLKLYIATGASILVVTCAGMSFLQTMRWRDDISMWGPMVERDVPMPHPYYMYGRELVRVGNHPRAVEVFESKWQDLISVGMLPLAFPRALYAVGRVHDAHSAARAIWYSPFNRDANAACDVLEYSLALGSPEPNSLEGCVAMPTLDDARLTDVSAKLPPDDSMTLRMAHTR